MRHLLLFSPGRPTAIMATKAKEDKILTIDLSEDEDSDDFVMKTAPYPPKMLDLAFLMDCTGSMSPYIHAVREVGIVCLI